MVKGIVGGMGSLEEGRNFNRGTENITGRKKHRSVNRFLRDNGITGAAMNICINEFHSANHIEYRFEMNSG